MTFQEYLRINNYCSLWRHARAKNNNKIKICKNIINYAYQFIISFLYIESQNLRIGFY